MITDIKTDGLDACGCGHKPEHYSIAYGRTPYSVQCACGKHTNRYRSIGGSERNIVDFWNQIAKLTELADLTYIVEVPAVGETTHTWKDKLKVRELYLDNRDVKIYYMFENGRIELERQEIYDKFLWKGIDY